MLDRARDRRSTLMASAASRRPPRWSSVSVASGSNTARVCPTGRASRVCCWTVAPIPNVRASLRARLEEGHGGGPVHEYLNVTPLDWSEQFHAPIFVSREALRLIEARGGGR